jgi:hypothetical protein
MTASAITAATIMTIVDVSIDLLSATRKFFPGGIRLL